MLYHFSCRNHGIQKPQRTLITSEGRVFNVNEPKYVLELLGQTTYLYGVIETNFVLFIY